MPNNPGRYWDKPWSLVDGCTPCSPGCDHCWSAAMAYRFCKYHNGTALVVANPDHPDGAVPPFFTGHIITRPDRLHIPLRTRKPTVFAIWNDLFHEAVSDEFRDQAFGMMANCERHIFLVLTKRADEMARYFDNKWRWALIEGNAQKIYADKYHEDPSGWFAVHDLPHVWMGVTVCNQQETDEKIPLLLQTPTSHKWISIEPMLGPIDISPYLINEHDGPAPFETQDEFYERLSSRIEAIVLGGETGPGARPLHPDWVRKIRDDCQAAGVPFYLKYLNKADGRVLDGKTHDDLPRRNDKGKRRGCFASA